MEKNSAIIVVDMLYDFIDGSLACLNADNAVVETVKFLNGQINTEDDSDGIYGSTPALFICDHHPADHCSFTANGGEWPPHCIAGTRGGEICEPLKPYVSDELCFYKGCDAGKEQYSGYEGVNTAGQSLSEVLSLLDIKDCYVCGIATEFCVRNTCEDLLHAGYNVHLLVPCLAYVNEDGHRKAISEMKSESIIIQ